MRLKQAAGLDGKIVKRHLKLSDSGADFWMLSDLVLQRLQNVLSALDVRFGPRIWLGIALAVCFHNHSPPVVLLIILRIRD